MRLKLPSFSGRVARLHAFVLFSSAVGCGSADTSTASAVTADATSTGDIAEEGVPSGSEDVTEADTAGDTESESVDAVDDDAAPTVEPDAVSPAGTRKTLTGSVKYTVAFTADAKAAGAKDCTYTRSYVTHEDTSAPWIFPQAETTFRGETTVENASCLEQVSLNIGYSLWLAIADDKYWLAGVGPPSANGPATVDGDHFAVSIDFTTDSAFITGAGSLTMGTEEGPTLDGNVPTGAYACGWPRANPPAYTGSNDLVVGATIPDGSFDDECGERVRLHDFKGTYFIIDFAASDCGPCQLLASIEESVVSDLRAKGIDVRVITLIRPFLDQPCIVGVQDTITQWKTEFAIKDPVLLDRCYSAALQSNHGKGAWFWGDDLEHMPSTIAVGRDLEVLAVDHGANFDAVANAILKDAGK